MGPDGRTARLDALGEFSGDWGGGTDVGWAAVAAAVRDRDGRGPRTALARLVPAQFGPPLPGGRSPRLCTTDGSRRRASGSSHRLTFAAAADGDAVAAGIVDRLADEIVAMAGAMIRRARLGRLDPDVVLGGGVFRTTDPAFYERIDTGVRAVAPGARLVRPAAPPVAGAALLGLDALGVADVGDRVRAAFVAWDATAG